MLITTNTPSQRTLNKSVPETAPKEGRSFLPTLDEDTFHAAAITLGGAAVSALPGFMAAQGNPMMALVASVGEGLVLGATTENAGPAILGLGTGLLATAAGAAYGITGAVTATLGGAVVGFLIAKSELG